VVDHPAHDDRRPVVHFPRGRLDLHRVPLEQPIDERVDVRETRIVRRVEFRRMRW
jgi:hypothetical protein